MCRAIVHSPGVPLAGLLQAISTDGVVGAEDIWTSGFTESGRFGLWRFSSIGRFRWVSKLVQLETGNKPHTKPFGNKLL